MAAAHNEPSRAAGTAAENRSFKNASGLRASCDVAGAAAVVTRLPPRRNPLNDLVACSARSPVKGSPSPPCRRLLWVGASSATLEFRLAAAETATILPMREVPDVPSACELPEADPPPTIICIAESRPGLIGFADVLALTRRWPLARVVSVESCLADGRRRSGPRLPGVTCIAWHDFPARLRWWLATLDAGRPGSLGLPLTARHEERWHREAAAGLSEPPTVTVAAGSPAAVDAASDLVGTAGGTVVCRTVGRPPIADRSAWIVWDLHTRIETELGWLRLLAGQRPGRGIVLLCSFPRGDAVAAAREAGATAVLGRPADPEAVAGVLTAAIGLSASPADR